MECKHGMHEPCDLCAEEDAEHDREMAIQARIDAAVAAERERWEKERDRMRDALLSIRTHCEPQPGALAAAIVATCDNGLGQPLTRVKPLGA